MKDKNGFTLVEILAVIVLISLILGLGIPSVIKLSKNMNKRASKTKIELVEEAALLWGNNNKSLLRKNECDIDGSGYDCYKVSIKSLIENEYLNSEKAEEIYYLSPTDNSDISHNCVYVYKKNNRIYAKYSETDIDCNE